MERTSINVLVTGTPGVGKSSFADKLAAATGLKHIDLADLIKEKQLHDGMDEDDRMDYVLNEDKVCDAIEEDLDTGGVVLDFHVVDFFPERWFDLVVVLRADSAVLYDRLERRGLNPERIQANIEAEIMQVISDEAQESYSTVPIVELPCNTLDDLSRGVSQVVAKLSQMPARMA